MHNEGAQVICHADGIPSPIVRWEAMNQTQDFLQRGLHILNNQRLGSTDPQPNEFWSSPGVQDFSCHATQEMRGRRPIEVVRHFEFIVTFDIPGYLGGLRHYTYKPAPGGWSCAQMPNAPGCAPNPKPSHFPVMLVLVIAISVIVCLVFLAVVFVVAFRCRQRLFAGWHRERQARFRAVAGRRGARRPQYAESDPPRGPLVVTAERPDRNRGQQAPASQQPTHHSVETLLTPPDYDSATQYDALISPPVPPPYDVATVPKDEDNAQIELQHVSSTSNRSTTSDTNALVVISIAPNIQEVAAADADSTVTSVAETVM